MVNSNNDQNQKISSELANSLQKVAKLFDEIKIPKIEIDPQRYSLAAENLGKRGWTIPFSLTPREVAFFEDSTLTNEDIDAYFLAYYSKEGNFERLLERIYSIHYIKQWHLALRQCEYAHRNGLYILSICTLLPILEGILSKFESNKDNIRMIKLCRDKLTESNQENTWIQTMAWTSCLHFITTLYKQLNFSKDEPKMINRHWILHGRTELQNSEVDSIRIFNAIETITHIVKYYLKK